MKKKLKVINNILIEKQIVKIESKKVEERVCYYKIVSYYKMRFL